MQFEIDQRDATNDSDKANMLLARAEEEKTVRQVAMATRLRIEDQKFLAEENIRRRSAAGMQVAHLRRAIDSARAEIASLEAAQSAPTGYRDITQRVMRHPAAHRWRTTLVNNGSPSCGRISLTVTGKFRCCRMRWRVGNELKEQSR